MELRAENGEKLTDELIESWANDAENGFPGYEFTRVDARTFRVADAPRRPRSIRVEDSLWEKTVTRAQSENTTASEIVRRALAEYLIA